MAVEHTRSEVAVNSCVMKVVPTTQAVGSLQTRGEVVVVGDCCHLVAAQAGSAVQGAVPVAE